jgi:hypothetical protein
MGKPKDILKVLSECSLRRQYLENKISLIKKEIDTEEKDLKQFKKDWKNFNYEIPDFVNDFFEVRKIRIEKLRNLFREENKDDN